MLEEKVQLEGRISVLDGKALRHYIELRAEPLDTILSYQIRVTARALLEHQCH